MIDLDLVLRALEAADVPIDAEGARDAVWLAARISERQPALPDDGGVPGTAPAVPSIPPTDTPVAAADASAASTSEAGFGERPTQSATLPGAKRAPAFSRVRLPLAAGLSGQRGVPAALRPLRRRTRSSASRAIDEAATVDRAIENDLWLPVYQRIAERWLELALVVDQGLSMAVWQDIVRNLRRLFVRAATFRDVRAWKLQTEGADSGAIVPVAAASSRVRPANPFGGGRRGLVLVVTDCVSAGWYDGSVLRQLMRWAHDSPVALLQVLPARMWPRTALANAAPVRVRAATPATTNAHLHWVADLPGPETNWRLQGAGMKEPMLILPVVGTGPAEMRRLARMMAGTSSESVDGMIFDSTSIEPPAPAPALTAQERTRGFWNVSSAAARELASLLAAAPVQSLGVLRLLRREMMAGADASAEAEVLVSGLVAAPRLADANAPDMPLTMDQDVRSILLENAPVARVLDVLRRVASETSLPGIATATFDSWILDPHAAERRLQATDPVADQIASVLTQIGGAYARIVEQVATSDAAATTSSAGSPEAGSETVFEGPAYEVRDDAPPADASTAGGVREIHVYVSVAVGAHAERAVVDEVISALNSSVGVTLNVRLSAVQWRAPSTEQGPGEVSKPMESADIFVGIIPGRRRLPAFVEQEFERAMALADARGRPTILTYFRDVPEGPTESVAAYDVDRNRVSVLVARLLERYAISRYQSEDELQRKLMIDLTGRLRPEASADVQRLEPRYLNPLPAAEPFVGRKAELEALQRWFEGTTRMVEVTGPRGIGKSALVAKWLSQRTDDPSGGIFVARANQPVEAVLIPVIEYFGGGAVSATGAYDLADQAIRAVAARPGRHLIVLDDVGAAGGEDGGVWERLVSGVTEQAGARVVLVSRAPWPETPAQALELEGLPDDESIALLRAHHVELSDTQLRAVARWAGGVPAVLNRLASEVSSGVLSVERLLAASKPDGPDQLDALLARLTVADARAEMQEMITRLASGALGAEQIDQRATSDLARRAIAAARRESRRALADTSLNAGTLLRMIGEHDAAREVLQEAVVAYELEGDKAATARALGETALVHTTSGDLDGALKLYDAAEEAASSAKDERLAATMQIQAASVLLERGDAKIAIARLQSALERLRSSDVPAQRASALALLGQASAADGDLSLATGSYEEALMLARRVEWPPVAVGRILHGLGEVAVMRGDYQRAEPFMREALAAAESSGSLHDVARTLVPLANVLAHVGRYDESHEALTRAEKTFRQLGLHDLADQVTRQRDQIGNDRPS